MGVLVLQAYAKVYRILFSIEHKNQSGYSLEFVFVTYKQKRTNLKFLFIYFYFQDSFVGW